MSASVGRNDPCPCGSGRKYKQCCEGKMRLNLKSGRGWVLGVLGLVVVAVVAWGLTRSQTRPTAPSLVEMPPSSPSTSASTATGTTVPGPSAPSTSAAPNSVPASPAPQGTGAPTTMSDPAGATPQAWTYDATTNRHFDPNHGHWHDGPPPPPGARGVASTPQPSLGQVPVPGAAGAGTPAPWTYDAQKNQHWNPEHGHWHPGPPPAGAP
jgi:hypothetical protein